MYTPSEIQEKVFKNGIGYDKKDVEQFLNELSSNHEALLQENSDLKKNLQDVNNSISYYKSIEKTLQRALILADKAAQETKSSALREAESIEMEAKLKSKLMLADSKKQIELLEHRFLNLIQQYNLFKIHFKNILNAQSEILSSNSFAVNTENFTYQEETQSQADAGQVHLHNEEDETDQEDLFDLDQLSLNLIMEQPAEQCYQEDGFEFIQMQDNH